MDEMGIELTDSSEETIEEIRSLSAALREDDDIQRMTPDLRGVLRKELIDIINDELGDYHFIPQRVEGVHIPGTGTIIGLIMNVDGVFIRRVNEHRDLRLRDPFLFYIFWLTPELPRSMGVAGELEITLIPATGNPRTSRLTVKEWEDDTLQSHSSYYEFKDEVVRRLLQKELPTIGRLYVLVDHEDERRYRLYAEYHRRPGDDRLFLAERTVPEGSTVEEEVRKEFGDALADQAFIDYFNP